MKRVWKRKRNDIDITYVERLCEYHLIKMRIKKLNQEIISQEEANRKLHKKLKTKLVQNWFKRRAYFSNYNKALRDKKKKHKHLLHLEKKEKRRLYCDVIKIFTSAVENKLAFPKRIFTNEDIKANYVLTYTPDVTLLSHSYIVKSSIKGSTEEFYDRVLQLIENSIDDYDTFQQVYKFECETDRNQIKSKFDLWAAKYETYAQDNFKDNPTINF